MLAESSLARCATLAVTSSVTARRAGWPIASLIIPALYVSKTAPERVRVIAIACASERSRPPPPPPPPPSPTPPPPPPLDTNWTRIGNRLGATANCRVGTSTGSRVLVCRRWSRSPPRWTNTDGIGTVLSVSVIAGLGDDHGHAISRAARASRPGEADGLQVVVHEVRVSQRRPRTLPPHAALGGALGEEVPRRVPRRDETR